MAQRFVWYELMTTDPTAAAGFYGGVIGWSAQDSGLTDRSYTILSVADAPIGGLMAMPPHAAASGAKPGWMGYVGVADVDRAASRVQAAGGAIHRAPDDIPGVGRFAVVADPQGAPFTLFQGAPGEQAPPPAAGTPGHVGWHELHSTNWEASFAFYSDLFGWTRSESHDMGAMGVYQIFAIDGVGAGGMFSHGEVAEHPFWLFYFTVPEINAAGARVTANGGRILNGPMEVPGGSMILHCADPQGAMFALVAPGR